MTKEELISQITSTISANGNQDITGTKLQEVLVSIVDTLYNAIDEATIDASPEDFTELILQSLGTRVDATMSQKAITDALTALNYGINAIPVFARIERDPAQAPSIVNSSTALPGEIVYVIYEHPYFKEGFYWKASDNNYYTWFGDAHLYKVDVNTPVRYNKLFECAEDGKQYVIVAGSTTAKPNLVILGTDSGSAVVESNDIPKFNGIIDSAPNIISAVAPTYEGIYFSVLDYTFVAKLGTDYYASWDTSHLYKDGPGVIESRLFEYNKQLYMYDGKALNLLSDMTKMAGYVYIGIATPSTTPITLTGGEKVFYIATEEGSYTNFGLGEITELSVIKGGNGSWKVDKLGEYLLHTTGGKMLGNIDMNGKRIDNIGIEEVDELPTFNLYEGRMVRLKNKTYTLYNGLWLALSDDLRGHTNDTHEENFVYQPTASDLSIKDGFADIKKLKGNTVVWNQLIQNGNFANGENNWSIEGQSISNNAHWDVTINNNIISLTKKESDYARLRQRGAVIANHKYLYSFSFWSNGVAPYGTDILGDSRIVNVVIPSKQYKDVNVWNSVKGIVIPTTSIENTNSFFALGGGVGTGHELKFKNMSLFDLTQMFGEGNEPATVEEFEAMFPNDYYEYNEGELLSFDGKGVKSVGFNQWDEEMETGKLNTTTGNNAEDTTRIRSKNYIKVFPSTKYYFTSPTGTNSSFVWIALYDKNYNIIQGYNGSGLQTSGNMFNIILAPDRNREFTTSPNAAYMRFYISTEFSHDICINLVHSGYRNGEYEKYEDYTLSFQDGNTISQLTGKLNGEGDSVVIFPDGLRSAGIVYDEIVYDEATGKRKAIKRIGKRSYITGDESQLNTLTDKINTYYELAEPEVYELDFPINTSYEAYDFGTEEVLYSDDKEVNIPMKASIEYGFNAVDMIRNNFEEIRTLKERVTALEQAILQIQAANTSTEELLEE